MTSHPDELTLQETAPNRIDNQNKKWPQTNPPTLPTLSPLHVFALPTNTFKHKFKTPKTISSLEAKQLKPITDMLT